jgi:hypothetical protein
MLSSSRTQTVDLNDMPGHHTRRLHQIAVAIFLQGAEPHVVVPAMLRAQRSILEPLPAAERREFVRMLRTLVVANNSLSRAPSEV